LFFFDTNDSGLLLGSGTGGGNIVDSSPSAGVASGIAGGKSFVLRIVGDAANFELEACCCFVVSIVSRGGGAARAMSSRLNECSLFNEISCCGASRHECVYVYENQCNIL
jgi:hypothetical protein